MKYGIGIAVVVVEAAGFVVVVVTLEAADFDFAVTLRVLGLVVTETTDAVVFLEIVDFVIVVAYDFAVTTDGTCSAIVALASDARANALIVTQKTILTGV